MILTKRIGNLLDLAEDGEVDVVVHQTNLEHTFGAGIARDIRHRFPWAYEADLRTPFLDPIKLGTVTVAYDSEGPLVANLYSQTSLSPSHTSYDAMVSGLIDLRTILKENSLGVERIGFPYGMGCGLADGNWQIVEAIIKAVFEDSEFEIVIVKLLEK